MPTLRQIVERNRRVMFVAAIVVGIGLVFTSWAFVSHLRHQALLHDVERDYSDVIHGLIELAESSRDADGESWRAQADAARSSIERPGLLGASVIVEYGEGFDVEARFVKPYIVAIGARADEDPSLRQPGSTIRMWRRDGTEVLEYERRIQSQPDFGVVLQIDPTVR